MWWNVEFVQQRIIRVRLADTFTCLSFNTYRHLWKRESEICVLDMLAWTNSQLKMSKFIIFFSPIRAFFILIKNIFTASTIWCPRKHTCYTVPLKASTFNRDVLTNLSQHGRENRMMLKIDEKGFAPLTDVWQWRKT